ncbi:MAG: reverse transcriptase family protein, partial [Candidatus Thiodiazotropha sp.]
MTDVLAVNNNLDTITPSLESINDITNNIAEIFTHAATRTFKQSNKASYIKRTFDKPWFGPACKIARKRYHRARHIFNLHKDMRSRADLKTQCKNYKQTMNKYINLHKKQKAKRLRDMHTKNPKEYWKYLNSLNVKSEKAHPPLNVFYEHFKNINQGDHPHENYSYTDYMVDNDQLNNKITVQEISKCIKNLKNGKCSGEDRILNEFIKSTEEIFLPTYEKLFNLVFDSGIIPNAWLEGAIIPIYKHKGDSNVPANYRPITILSCLGKLFTAVLNNRLTKFLDENESLNENQAGFRKGYGVTDHIFVLHSLIEIMKKSKQKLFCAFVDFSQAFDSIWRGGLFRKLHFNSIQGKFLRIIYNMYENIKSCVKLSGESSQ